MKKVKLTGKLSLNKEIVAKLTNSQMATLRGGDLYTYGCPTTSNAPTQTSCSCENCTNGTCSTGC